MNKKIYELFKKKDIPITEKETDVIVFNEPISIKTVTNKKVVGVTCSRTNKSCAIFTEQKYAPLLFAADVWRYAVNNHNG